MAERASVFEKPRLGVEAAASPGVPVPANLVLQSLTLTPKPVLVRNPIKAAGVSRPVGVSTAKGHTEFSYDAAASYNDLAVLLSSVLCRPTASVVASGVTSLTYKPTCDAANTMSTFTVQNGSVNGASSFPGAWINDLTIAFGKNEAKISGNGMGRRLDDDITPTPSPNYLALIPIESDKVEVRIADTYAALATATNKMTRLTSSNWSITGRQSGIITLDPAQGSFSGQVERNHDMAAQIVMHLDSQGVAVMDRYREGQTFWVRYIATSTRFFIATGQPYTFQISFPCYVSSDQRSNVDDAYAGTYDLVPLSVMDGSFNSFTEVIMQVPTAVANMISTEGAPNTSYNPTVANGQVTSDATDAADGVQVTQIQPVQTQNANLGGGN